MHLQIQHGRISSLQFYNPYLIISLLENFPKRSMVNPPCRSTNPRLFPVSTPVSTIGVFKVAATASAKLPNAMHAALKSHPNKKKGHGGGIVICPKNQRFFPQPAPWTPSKSSPTFQGGGLIGLKSPVTWDPMTLRVVQLNLNFTKSDRSTTCARVQSRVFWWYGHPTNPYIVYTNPTIELIDHPLLWNNWSLDLSTHKLFII